MYTLLIDGNFFGQRMLHATKITFLKDPKTDEKLLIDALTEALVNEVKPLKNIIDSVIIARDYSSWRKLETPIIAPEIKADLETDEIEYKANRDKEVKKYDEEKFFGTFDKWCAMCEEKMGIPTLKSRLAEADDIVYVISLLLNTKGKKTIMWTSDGDFPHMVNENNFLIKLPKKELLIVSGKPTSKVVTMESLFADKKPDRSNLLLNAFQGNTVVINPMESLLIKLIYGDKKDNVHAIFQWNAKTGTRRYRPTGAMIEKALEVLSESLSTVTMAQLYDDDFIRAFLKELLLVCKQERNIDNLMKIYKWNLKAKHLHKNQIPMDVIRGVYENYKSKVGFSTDMESIHSKSAILEKFDMVEVGTFFDGIEIMDY